MSASTQLKEPHNKRLEAALWYVREMGWPVAHEGQVHG